MTHAPERTWGLILATSATRFGLSTSVSHGPLDATRCPGWERLPSHWVHCLWANAQISIGLPRRTRRGPPLPRTRARTWASPWVSGEGDPQTVGTPPGITEVKSQVPVSSFGMQNMVQASSKLEHLCCMIWWNVLQSLHQDSRVHLKHSCLCHLASVTNYTSERTPGPPKSTSPTQTRTRITSLLQVFPTKRHHAYMKNMKNIETKVDLKQSNGKPLAHTTRFRRPPASSMPSTVVMSWPNTWTWHSPRHQPRHEWSGLEKMNSIVE